jgi:hypothetical protein
VFGFAFGSTNFIDGRVALPRRLTSLISSNIQAVQQHHSTNVLAPLYNVREMCSIAIAKIISEKVEQTCGFARNRRSDSPTFS